MPAWQPVSAVSTAAHLLSFSKRWCITHCVRCCDPDHPRPKGCCLPERLRKSEPHQKTLFEPGCLPPPPPKKLSKPEPSIPTRRQDGRRRHPVSSPGAAWPAPLVPFPSPLDSLLVVSTVPSGLRTLGHDPALLLCWVLLWASEHGAVFSVTVTFCPLTILPLRSRRDAMEIGGDTLRVSFLVVVVVLVIMPHMCCKKPGSF